MRGVSQVEPAQHANPELIELYRLALEGADLVEITDSDGRITYVNDNYCRVSGYAREELIGKTHDEIGWVEMPKSFMDHMRRTIADGVSWEGDICNRSKYGSPFWVSTTIIPHIGPDGRPSHFIALRRDITERKRLEGEITRTNRWLSDFIENMPSGAVSIDGDSISFNRAVESLTGFTRDEILDLDSWYGAVLHRDRSTEPVGLETVVIPVYRRDGTVRQVQFNTVMNGKTQILLLLDLTDQKRAQERAILSSKMLSLGEMASGIAHEINNPLAIIRGRAQQLRESLLDAHPDPEKISRYTSQIEETVDRIAKIILGLRNFAREATDDPFMPANLAEIIDQTLSLCKNRFKIHGIDLRVNVAQSEELQIRCRSVQISQVFLNLLNNAYDALSPLGPNASNWVELTAKAQGEGVEITLTDSGPGIEPDLRSKIMEPFFTTKKVGAGTGLGLSIAQGLVQAHHGKLTLDEANPHTRFVVWLPKNPQAHAISDEENGPNPSSSGHLTAA
jgi:PAS domain S-box-containing protein